MEPISALLFFALFVVAFGYVAWPLLRPRMAGEGASARELRRTQLAEEKDRLLGAVRDLEHDRETGKIDDADFQALASRLKLEAAKVLRDLDVNEGRRLRRTERPSEASAGSAAAAFGSSGGGTTAPEAPAGSEHRFCTRCGRRVAIDDRFCGGCGVPLSGRAT